MIEARGLTKYYGSTLAVNDLSFTIRPRHGDRLSRPPGGPGAGGTAASVSEPSTGEGDLQVRGLTEDQAADIAFASGIRLNRLAPSRVSLEQAFLELTADSVACHAELHASLQSAHNGSEA